MKKTLLSFLTFIACHLAAYATGPTSTLGGTTVITGTACFPANDYQIYSFKIDQSGGSNSATHVAFATTGSYVSGDISKFSLYASTTNSFPGGTAIATITSGIGTSSYSFDLSSSPYSLATSTTYYFWITANVTSGATAGHTIVVSLSSVTLTSGSTSSSGPTGTTQTFEPTPTITGASTPLCVGSTVNLSATPSGGTWSSLTTGKATVGSSNGHVTGAGAGTATIQYTATGCSSTYGVNVNALPSLSGVSASPNPICSGATLSLNAAVSGGAGGLSTTWTGPNSLSHTTTVLPPDTTLSSVTTAAAGSYSISVTDDSGCVASSSTSPLTVNGITASANPDPVCAGHPLSLNSVVSGTPTSYRWDGASVLTDTSGYNGMILAAASGDAVVYTLTVVFPTCTLYAYTAPVTVNALPVPTFTSSGSSPYCTDSSVTFTTQAGQSNYVWTLSTGDSILSGGISSTDNTVTLQWTTSGSKTVSVLYTDATTGCTATSHATQSDLVHMRLGNISGTSVVCTSLSTSLHDAVAGGTWTTSSADSARVNFASISVTGDTTAVSGVAVGSATISYSVSGCPTSTFTLSVNSATPSGISGTDSVCAGSSVSLTDGTTSGIWSSNSPTIASIDQAGFVTGLTEGTTKIYFYNGCGMDSVVFIAHDTTNINPRIANETACNGSTINTLFFAGTHNTTGAYYIWMPSDSAAIGLASVSSYMDSVGSFVVNNTGTHDSTVTIIATPFSMYGCPGTKDTFTITGHPTPAVSAPTIQQFCNGTTDSIDFNSYFISDTNITNYSWTNNAPSLAVAAGTSAINDTGHHFIFNATNGTPDDATFMLTVTPFIAGCTAGTAVTVTDTVHPTPSVTINVASMVSSGDTLCSGATQQSIIFNTNSTSPDNYFTYSMNNAAGIGYVVVGSDTVNSIGTFTVTNTTSTTAYDIITVTPHIGGCANGGNATYEIGVHPLPTVKNISSYNLVFCNGNSIVLRNFSDTVMDATTSYQWIASDTNIFTPGSGSYFTTPEAGNVSPFTAYNGGTSLVMSTFSVTATTNYAAPALACSYSATFAVSVNPQPNINVVRDTFVPPNAPVTLDTIRGIFDSLLWTNSQINIASPVLISRDSTSATDSFVLPAFTSFYPGSSNTDNIVITPYYNGCSGSARSFAVTVNQPLGVTIGDNRPNDTLCNATTSQTVDFAISGDSTSGTPDHYVWTCDCDSPNTKGLFGSTLTGSVTATPVSYAGTLTVTANNNSTDSVAYVTYSVTAYYSNGGRGTPTTKTIFVLPDPKINVSSNFPQTICSGSTMSAVTFSPAVSSLGSSYYYSWNFAPSDSCNTSYTMQSGSHDSIVSDTIRFYDLSRINYKIDTLKIIPYFLIDSITGGNQTSYTHKQCYIVNAASPSGIFTVNPTPLYNHGPLINQCSDSLFTFDIKDSIQTHGTQNSVGWTINQPSQLAISVLSGTDAISVHMYDSSLKPINAIFNVAISVNGCSYSDSVVDTVLPVAKIYTPLQLSDTVCNQGVFNFYPADSVAANIKTRFVWSYNPIDDSVTASITKDTISINDSLKNDVIANTSITSVKTIKYIYTSTVLNTTLRTTVDSFTCPYTQTVNVTVFPSPHLDSTTATICAGTPINFPLTSTQIDASAINYIWTKRSSADFGNTINTAVIIDTITNAYGNAPTVAPYVVVTNSTIGSHECQTANVVTITLNPTPLKPMIELPQVNGIAIDPAKIYAGLYNQIYRTNITNPLVQDTINQNSSYAQSLNYVWSVVNTTTNSASPNVIIHPSHPIISASGNSPSGVNSLISLVNDGSTTANIYNLTDAVYFSGYPQCSVNAIATKSITVNPNKNSALTNLDDNYILLFNINQSNSNSFPIMICFQYGANRKYLWGYDDTALNSYVLQNSATAEPQNQQQLIFDHNNLSPAGTQINISDTSRYWFWVQTTDTSLTDNSTFIQKFYYQYDSGKINAMRRKNITTSVLQEPVLKLLPNPASSSLALNLTDTGTGIISYQFYDYTGRLISNITTYDDNISIPLDGFVPGNYLVICSRNGRKISEQKFIKL